MGWVVMSERERRRRRRRRIVVLAQITASARPIPRRRRAARDGCLQAPLRQPADDSLRVDRIGGPDGRDQADGRGEALTAARLVAHDAAAERAAGVDRRRRLSGGRIQREKRADRVAHRHQASRGGRHARERQGGRLEAPGPLAQPRHSEGPANSSITLSGPLVAPSGLAGVHGRRLGLRHHPHHGAPVHRAGLGEVGVGWVGGPRSTWRPLWCRRGSARPPPSAGPRRSRSWCWAARPPFRRSRGPAGAESRP